MKSMTGFGRAEVERKGYSASVELKSVNHRFLDVSVKLPRVVAEIEDGVKKTLGTVLQRGHVDAYVSCENKNESAYSVEINDALASKYVEASKIIAERFGIINDVNVSFIMKQPDVVTATATTGDQELGNVIIECVKNAVVKLDEMRLREGKALEADMLKKIDGIEQLVVKVRERAPRVVESYREKLEAKLRDYTKEVEPDEGRLLTEVAVFTDRASIDEEITRLFAHVEHFRSIVKETEPVGRKLDFLVQEMNRECNTIGSKANDKIITDYVLSLKTEVEKLREQVQNIE